MKEEIVFLNIFLISLITLFIFSVSIFDRFDKHAAILVFTTLGILLCDISKALYETIQKCDGGNKT